MLIPSFPSVHIYPQLVCASAGSFNPDYIYAWASGILVVLSKGMFMALSCAEAVVFLVSFLVPNNVIGVTITSGIFGLFIISSMDL